jgi:hypothetical protein
MPNKPEDFPVFTPISLEMAKSMVEKLNEVSLLCFWILKLHPFFSDKIQSDILNAKIAVYLFLTAASYTARSGNKHINTADRLVENLYYAFRFRDLSKEAIMALAESLIY